MSAPLIVALDFNQKQEALKLCDALDPKHCAVKVGSEMFTLFGADFVRSLVNKGFRVFLDLKFHDIPNTVAKACKAAAELGVWMLNVHASGGINMMRAAKEAVDSMGAQKPLLIAVTVLTSMNEQELQAVGVDNSILNQASKLAHLAALSGLDGVVCSAHEAKQIKENLPQGFICVTPGIRLTAETNDDQHRIMTPDKALALGSDYLVIGRPITSSSTPSQTLDHILKLIAE